MNMIDASRRGWTLVGLAFALGAMPLVIGLFNILRVPWTTQNVLAREIALFACAPLCCSLSGTRSAWVGTLWACSALLWAAPHYGC